MTDTTWVVVTTDSDHFDITASKWEEYDNFVTFYKEDGAVAGAFPWRSVKAVIPSARAEAISPSVDLSNTTDAATWAAEFCRTFPGVMDEGTMIGWFANAMQTAIAGNRAPVTADVRARAAIEDEHGG